MAAPSQKVDWSEDASLSGLRMRLSDAEPPSGAGDLVRFVEGEPMSEKDVATLLGRVPDVASLASDKQSFALREGSLPPPRPGRTEPQPFPPPPSDAQAPEASKGPLEVLRFAPEGDVPLAPYVSATFSSPMVEVTSQQAAAATTPLTISPMPRGSFRWLGTKTVVFQPEGRMPMATEYTVKIPKGTRPAVGAPLAKELSFSFRTPPLGLVHKHPEGGPQRLRPVVVLGFDQRIHAESLLPFVAVEQGQRAVPMRLATADELKADEAASRVAEGLEKDRLLVLIPVDGLVPATRYTVRVKQGAPSAEGPRTTPGDQAFELYTYERLRLVESRCDWYEQCPPNASWSIHFNNELDAESFDPLAIGIEPKVPGVVVSQYGSTVRIEGPKRGRTQYTVTLPADLRDIYGQRLGRDEQVKFEVGPAQPTLFGPNKPMVTLDPAGKPTLSIFTINHDEVQLTVHAVRPQDWAAYLDWQRRYNQEDKDPGALPGKRVASKKLKLKGGPDALTETAIDLSSFLEKGRGQLIVRVALAHPPKERWNRSEVLTWVQATNLGLTAFADDEELVTLVTRLSDGKPMAGAQVSLLGDKTTTRADEQGLARFRLPNEPTAPQILLATADGDTAMLLSETYYWNEYARWRHVQRSDELRWFSFDDRKMYKPGEQVRIKGWLRKYENKRGGDVASLARRPKAISYLLRDPRGNELKKGKADVSKNGGFDLTLTLPDNTNLGTAWVELTAEGDLDAASSSHSHSFEVQEFRRPEFEVSASMAEPDYVLGERATSTATASYYSGGGLAGSKVSWTVTASTASYSPPGWSEYGFGPYHPWWRFYDQRSVTSVHHEATTNGLGEHNLAIHFEAMNPPEPMAIEAEARVEDVNRQALAGRSRALLHPADVYAGLRFDRAFVEKGQAIDLAVVAVDIEGKRASGTPIDVQMVRLAGRYSKGKWIEEALDPEDCRVTPSDEPGRCTFTPKQGGVHKLSATVRDGHGRRNVTELQVWVAGEKSPPKRDVEMEEVQLIPERKDVTPGHTAKFLVVAPFFPAEGVLTVRRSGLHSVQRFHMDGPTHTVTLKVGEEHVPNITVEVDLVGSAPRTDDAGVERADLPRRVAYASGALELDVPPRSRTLEVSATPQSAELEPSAKTSVSIEVKDAAGQPVQDAEVAVVVVDEAVLALTGYALPDPLSIFYAKRDAGVNETHSRELVLLADPAAVAAALAGALDRAESAMTTQGAVRTRNHRGGVGGGAVSEEMRGAMPMPPPSAMPMMAMAKMAPPGEAMMEGDAGPAGPAIALRTDLRALAAFAPKVMTDANGRATVPLTLPDSLTRYRVMAVAASGKNSFGAGESSMTARLPLQVRPSAPRFLNFGDEILLPVVVQNQTDEPMTVSVAVRATNAVLGSLVPSTEKKRGTPPAAPHSLGRRVTVPARDRLEVRFPAAADMAGRARFQVVAAAGKATDAAELDIPVWTPATTEAFATYGELDEGAMAQPVRAPGDVWPQFGGLEVSTSSTQLSALTDAVVYLATYPYDCSEQIASRVLAIAALKDVLGAFKAEGLPEPEALRASIDKDLKTVLARQNGDGGFAFWRRGDESWPYLTIHVAHALARAKQKGYEVPQWPWNRVMGYLRSIESHIPTWYSLESRLAIRAYALYTLHHLGDSKPGDAEALYKEHKDKLSLEALGWLLPVLAKGNDPKTKDAILRHLGNRVAETAGAAHFATSYSDGAHVLLHSDRRADGVLLEALVEVAPGSDLIPKVVRGLLGHRTAGKWASTQENAFVLLGLDRYFQVFEKVTPDFVARVWLGKGLAGEHAFKGRTTEEARIDIPMATVIDKKGKAPLTIAKEGAGRLYYRIGMRYAPRDLKLLPADYGFTVSRTYEAVDKPDDVKRDADGTWRVKAGARVRVRLNLVAPTRRYHVALVDPLPAGLEVINPALAVSESVPPDPNAQQEQGRFWWWMRPWYEHQNLRDERVEAFTSLLWEGVHEYTYVTRATTPGRFVVPPTKAEEMYAPETFGRAGTDRVIVE